MKINPYGISLQQEAYLKTIGLQNQKNAPTAAGQTEAGPADADRIELSAAAKEMQAARQTLDELPAVRSDKVARLKAQIENGTYEINSRKIAASMIKDSLLSVYA